jgi:hypothetical protein
MLYVEFVGFDLITAGIRFKYLQVWSKSKAAVDTKDSTFGIEEPPSTKLELQIRFLSLVQLD